MGNKKGHPSYYKGRHGMCKTPTYKSWSYMKSRCAGYGDSGRIANYVNKGIVVCDKWQKFEGFLEDMGIRPEGMELDRIDGAKGYNKDNCRWTTHGHNQANKIQINKSGLPRGVRIKYGRYQSQMYFKSKYYAFGTFDTPEEAHSVYVLKYKEFRGELPPEERSINNE